jgi:adenosylcobinamide-phosphate synthase
MAELLVGASALVGTAIDQALSRGPLFWRSLIAAALLKQAFSLRELGSAAALTGRLLAEGQLEGARSSLRPLVSRPAADLDSEHAASAAIESLAENLSDSVVAPLLYYLGFGLPGALAYRAANTLDAMIGYHGPHEEIGKAAARLDDLLNLAPSRLSALLLVAAAWLGFGDARAAWETLRRDHARTESPNAGWPMSAMAGALHVRLEKIDHYRLGESFAAPTPRDIHRARRLYYAAAGLGLTLALAAAQIKDESRRSKDESK